MAGNFRRKRGSARRHSFRFGNYLPGGANLTYTQTSFTIKPPLSPVASGVNTQGYAVQNISVNRNTSLTIKARPNGGTAAAVGVAVGLSILFPPGAPAFLAPAFAF